MDRRIDWLGAALITVGLIFLQFVISDGQTAPQGWKTSCKSCSSHICSTGVRLIEPDILALLIIGVLMIAAFFVWEHHIQTKTSRPPLMRLQLWTRAKGRLAAVYFIGFVTWMCFVVSLSRLVEPVAAADHDQSLFYHATLFYQEVQGASPIQAMLWFLPTTVSGVLCNVIVAWLIARVPTQWIICTGIVATGYVNHYIYRRSRSLIADSQPRQCPICYFASGCLLLALTIQRHVAIRSWSGFVS